MTNTTYDTNFVRHIGTLAKLDLTDEQAAQLAGEFQDSMPVVDALLKIDTTGLAPTYQVNSLSNVTHPDVADEAHMFSQKQALANAPRQHEGYFVVERVIDHEA